LPDPTARADEPGDPLERLEFVVVEFFTARDARCRELAVAFFAGDDWKAVALAEGRSHDVIRKQWSRCLGILRETARDDRGPRLDGARSGWGCRHGPTGNASLGEAPAGRAPGGPAGGGRGRPRGRAPRRVRRVPHHRRGAGRPAGRRGWNAHRRVARGPVA